MGKIGSYEYPDIQFGTLLKAVETLWVKFKGKANDEKMFAESLGHKTNNSGGFLMKLADLRRYGLIEKRGIEITSRAKGIFVFVKPETKKIALNEAIMEIRLWKDLYQRLETTSPSSDDFKLQLAELSGDTEKVVSSFEIIRNLYIDAMQHFTKQIDTKIDNDQDIGEKNEEKDVKRTEKVPETQISLQTGEVSINLPKNDANIEIIKSILDGLKNNK